MGVAGGPGDGRGEEPGREPGRKSGHEPGRESGHEPGHESGHEPGHGVDDAAGAADRGIPLARLLVMGARTMIDGLHERLQAAGWPAVPQSAGYVLLAARDGPTTGAEVASLMRTSRQAASKLLEGLETAGLIHRRGDDDDARRKLVVLSERGRRLLADVESAYESMESEWAHVVGRAELESMRGALTAAVASSHGGTLPAVGPVT